MKKIDIDGRVVDRALLEIKVNVIMAKLTDILLDIEELEQLNERIEKNEKNFNRNYDRLRQSIIHFR